MFFNVYPNDKWLDTYLPFLDIKLLNKYERWRQVAKILKVSKKARLRLSWIIYYHTKTEGNASLTSRHFGIARKTFYKWFNKFDEDNLYTLYLLEDRSRAPKRTRQREITDKQERRVVKLRKTYPQYGKVKLAKLYQRKYNEKLSSWKIQKVIEKYQLYPNPKKATLIRRRKARTRARSTKKKRLTELKLGKMPRYQRKAGYIICLDTITIYTKGLKRYIFTAIDVFSKLAYARMYKSKSSLNAKDFLQRLYYLMDGEIPRVGHDNGSEFAKYFKKECAKLGIDQYYSRVRTPKDNSVNERFNRTLQYEFMKQGYFSSDPEVFNPSLTNWLIEYNFRRPHQSLDYQTPAQTAKVLPMSSSCTVSCFFVNHMIIWSQT